MKNQHRSKSKEEVVPDNIINEFRRINLIPPNNLHLNFLNMAYKYFTAPLKSWPLKLFIPIAILITVLIYVFFGKLLVSLATYLQYGF